MKEQNNFSRPSASSGPSTGSETLSTEGSWVTGDRLLSKRGYGREQRNHPEFNSHRSMDPTRSRPRSPRTRTPHSRRPGPTTGHSTVTGRGEVEEESVAGRQYHHSRRGPGRTERRVPSSSLTSSSTSDSRRCRLVIDLPALSRALSPTPSLSYGWEEGLFG